VSCDLATGIDLERFRAAIIRRIGLQFDDGKLGFLGEVLQRRLEKHGRSGNAYLWDLEHGPSNGEIAALARELTVGETYFFRNNEQFRALAEVVLPERIRAHPLHKVLRLLSAGCASGEEAYSMAIVARETVADPSWDVQIQAVDLNPASLEKAARARYSSWALRDTPLDVQRKWFRPDGRDMILDETVRAAVNFDAENLVSDDSVIWAPAAYDAIFCRNVLMYFAPDQMRAVIARIAGSLAPGGFLFLGHAETLRGVSDEFHLRHTHETFYYEVKDSTEPTWRRPPQFVPRSASGGASAALDEAWFETIAKASERVAALMPGPIAASPPAGPPLVHWDLAPALDLLRQERFAEALDHVRAGPPGAERDPDVLLLEATLLAHGGQLAAAEDACLRLLMIDELNAGAHYVLALCREHSEHRERAIRHDQTAAYLDPTFAMPRLHLGLLARRAGDRDAARRELAKALVLLRREDASRLLLFGGGFNREALMALCESALRDSGGRP
jgi:chemotaxis protein methyltransferase CheR